MRRRKGRNVWRRAAILALIAAVSGIVAVYAVRMQRIFMEYAVNICEDSAMQEINNLMQDEVFSHPEIYENMVTLEHDSEQRITALRTDTIAIGRMKARLVNGLFERLGDLEQTTVEVPLGTVFAPHYFSGMGPSVDIGMVAMAQMDAEFVSAFSAAGLNQTRHNILIHINAGFRILTPFGGKECKIETSYPVTDTVIVGIVPEQYMNIEDLQGNLLGRIKDHDNSQEKRK